MNTDVVKKRIEIFVSEEIKERLSEIAASKDIGVATVVKLAISDYLNNLK